MRKQPEGRGPLAGALKGSATPPARLGPRARRAALAGAALALLAAGCASLRGPPPPPPPVINPAVAGSAALSDDLQTLQKLAQGQPAEQAEIVASAQHDYDTAPTPSHQLKLALVLGTPGHPAANLPRAQGLLREVVANPEMLLPGGGAGAGRVH
jgi:hypothetical protein